MKGNYHTHTVRCKHALEADEKYVQAAIAAGFDELGFADHAPWPFPDGFVGSSRMLVDQLPDYISQQNWKLSRRHMCQTIKCF